MRYAARGAEQIFLLTGCAAGYAEQIFLLMGRAAGYAAQIFLLTGCAAGYTEQIFFAQVSRRHGGRARHISKDPLATADSSKRCVRNVSTTAHTAWPSERTCPDDGACATNEDGKRPQRRDHIVLFSAHGAQRRDRFVLFSAHGAQRRDHRVLFSAHGAQRRDRFALFSAPGVRQQARCVRWNVPPAHVAPPHVEPYRRTQRHKNIRPAIESQNGHLD